MGFQVTSRQSYIRMLSILLSVGSGCGHADSVKCDSAILGCCGGPPGYFRIHCSTETLTSLLHCCIDKKGICVALLSVSGLCKDRKMCKVVGVKAGNCEESLDNDRCADGSEDDPIEQQRGLWACDLYTTALRLFVTSWKREHEWMGAELCCIAALHFYGT